jgi:hypothetical protein
MSAARRTSGRLHHRTTSSPSVEAFHRLDRPRVARLAFAWLKPGGALVTLGFGSLDKPVAPWSSVVAAIVREFIGEPARRLGAPNTTPAEELADQEREIGDAGFADVTTRTFVVSHEWTVETLLGHARSTSTLSRAALGARHADFEAALTKRCSPSTVTVDTARSLVAATRSARRS